MDKIYELIYASIGDINKLRTFINQIPSRPDICLNGSRSVIDSLEFINLMVTIEQKIENDFRIKIILTGPELRKSASNPFETIKSLHDYINRIIEKQSSD